MSLHIYPNSNYDSWINVVNARIYFSERLHADDLIDSNYYDSDKQTVILEKLQHAQCEQALHELQYDADLQKIKGLTLGGLISVRFDPQDKPSRYSERALAIVNFRIILTQNF